MCSYTVTQIFIIIFYILYFAVIGTGRNYAIFKKTSLRIRESKWEEQEEPTTRKKQHNNRVTRNYDVLDIGRNMDGLPEGSDEAVFYKDQLGDQKYRVGKEVDESYQLQKKRQIDQERQSEQQILAEMDFIDEEGVDITNKTQRLYPECSKCINNLKVVKVDQAVQVDLFVTPDIRNNRNATTKIKDTVASVSSVGAISVEKARLVTQTVCKKLYGHLYQLEPLSSECHTLPRSAADYNRYKNVLPSSRAVREFKHKKALAQEIQAAQLIITK